LKGTKSIDNILFNIYFLNILGMNDLQRRPNRKYLLFIYPLCIGLLLILQLFSCKKDEKCTIPEIDSITLENDSVQIDYLIPTTTITVHGIHFDNALYVYINQAKFDARYIYHTDTAITFMVPYVSSNHLSTDTTALTDSLMITKTCGKSLLNVRIKSAPPYIRKISNEHAMAGDIVTLKGNYFANLRRVVFPSFKNGEILDGYNDTLCRVVVPRNAITEGKITLISASGSSTSAYGIDFWDRSGLICNFDDVDTWEGWGGTVTSNYSDPEMPPADQDFFECELSNIAPGSGEIESSILPYSIQSLPDYPGNLAPSYFAIQTEMYLKYPWKCGYYKILMGKRNNADELEYSYEYNYQPWADTLNKGEFMTDGWETVNIPLTDFQLSGSTSIKLQSFSQLRLINYMQWSFVNPPEEEGGKPLTHFKIGLDNLRIIQLIATP
jgi:hypothetical protein